MPTNHIFLIDSDSSGHQLTVNGKRAGTFASLSAAEAMAAYIALRFLPTATLKLNSTSNGRCRIWRSGPQR